VAEWFRGPLRHRLPDLLAGRDSLLPSFLDAARVRRAADAYVAGSGRAYRQVLAFFVLEHFLRFNLTAPGTESPPAVTA
jgi:hypothetical protein